MPKYPKIEFTPDIRALIAKAAETQPNEDMVRDALATLFRALEWVRLFAWTPFKPVGNGPLLQAHFRRPMLCLTVPRLLVYATRRDHGHVSRRRQPARGAAICWAGCSGQADLLRVHGMRSNVGPLGSALRRTGQSIHLSAIARPLVNGQVEREPCLLKIVRPGI